MNDYIDISRMTPAHHQALACMYFAKLPKTDIRYKKRNECFELFEKKFNKKATTYKQAKDTYDAYFETNNRVGYKDAPISRRGMVYQEVYELYKDYDVDVLEKAVDKIMKLYSEEKWDYMALRLTDPISVHSLLNGVRELTVDRITDLNEYLNQGRILFIALGGDKGKAEVDWDTGFFAIGHVTKAPYDIGYEKNKRGTNYFKFDFSVDVVLDKPIPRSGFINYPNTYDAAYIGLELHRDRSQANSMIDNDQAVAIIRATIDMMPHLKEKFEKIFPDDFMERVLGSTKVLVETQINFGQDLKEAVDEKFENSQIDEYDGEKSESCVSEKLFIRVGAGVGKDSEFESFINGNYAGIGWNEIGNLNEIIDKSENPKADIAELLGQIYYSDKTETGRKRVSAKKAGEILAFFDAKAYENYFVAMKGRRVLAIGQITGDYYFDESKMFGHCRPVDWIKIFSDEQIFLPEDEGYLTTCCDIIKENNIEFLNSLINGNDMPEEEIFFDYEEFKTDNKKYKRNLILHGAPGTGKSHSIEKLRKDLIGDEPNYTRVTFHPDYTYSGFVGTYKPVPLENGENSEITYEYMPGPFMKILTESLMHQDVPYLLIIEEINRANTAAVFGDVFQLLDRDNTGKSQYPVNVSKDMKSYLKKITGIDFDEIRIPSNMFIWATMNSADQGVYPMDTAFKRRWSFSYIGLNDSEDKMRKYDVILGETAQQRVNWNKLRNALNDKLTLLGINEDKLLGPFFISEHDMSDEKGFSEVFKDKVISYLFEDAARGKRNKLFKTPVKRYSEICRDFDIRGTEIFDFEDVNTDFSPVSGLAGNE